jgi:hypothetical protein
MTNHPPKSLMRSSAHSGNPQAKNLFKILSALQEKARVQFRLKALQTSGGERDLPRIGSRTPGCSVRRATDPLRNDEPPSQEPDENARPLRKSAGQKSVRNSVCPARKSPRAISAEGVSSPIIKEERSDGTRSLTRPSIIVTVMGTSNMFHYWDRCTRCVLLEAVNALSRKTTTR